MVELRIYTDAQNNAPFEQWLETLKDRTARAKVRARLERVKAGNFGDCKAVRDGVQDAYRPRAGLSRVFKPSGAGGGAIALWR